MDLLKKKINKEVKGVVTIQDIRIEENPLEYTEMKIIDLEVGSLYEERLGKKEVCIVILTGKVNVSDGKETFENIGTRINVFDKVPTDSVYVSNDQQFTITAVNNAKVALTYAPSENQLPTRLISSEDNYVENRGKYLNQRTVHNILPDNVDFANNLLVVEVFTNSGNWSSYPPHKHDKNNLPHESLLEEIYYHEMNPSQGFVFQRVYTDNLEIDETMAVKHRDCVVVPRGYHPVGVPDGYDSYYLNVMAGPIRKWQFHNDKDHEWILDRK